MYKLLSDITCYKTKRVISKKNDCVEIIDAITHLPVVIVKNKIESFSVRIENIKEC